MSIWKELYEIFDKERAHWKKSSAGKQAVVFELNANLTFLADSIEAKSTTQQIAMGLENAAFDAALRDGIDFNSICKRKLSKQVVGDFVEFNRYLNKDADYLIKNAYQKIKSIKKIASQGSQKDLSLKIKSLFKFHVLLLAYIEGRHLTRRIKGH